MAITLHVGASKCGSSALQTALSAAPDIVRDDGSQVRYVAIDLHRQRLLEGKALTGLRGIMGYRVSPSAEQVLKGPLDRIGAQLRRAPHDLVLSNEGWLFQPGQWKNILAELNLRVDVVVYVRPQVNVLNSAWWQWGAWSDEPFDEWMDHRLKASLWGERIARWKTLGRVRSIRVVPVVGDVVEDFYTRVLKAPMPEHVSRPNPSLPGPILRLFQRNRVLRPGPHGAKIDFALSRKALHDDPPIWVMDRDLIVKVLEATRADNELLMSFMDPQSAEQVRQDPRWWSAESFADKQAESPDPVAIDPAKLEELCVSMAQELLALQS